VYINSAENGLETFYATSNDIFKGNLYTTKLYKYLSGNKTFGK